MINHEAQLARQIQAQLERDTRVNLHAYPIHIQVGEDGVHLEGTVADIAAKRIARNRTHQITAGLPVLDRLLIAVPDTDTNGQLRNEVVNLLQGEPEFKNFGLVLRSGDQTEILRSSNFNEWGDYRIEIEVEEPGVVRLSGPVLSLSHRRLAEVLAWWAAGCRRVDNLLHVTPPERESDDELADAVRLVLEKDPLVGADNLGIGVEHGTVTLDGYVGTDEERQLAILDVWYIPGVQDVVDRLHLAA